MFLVCGEALFDVFITDGVPVSASTVPFTAKIGGSPFNVAVGLSRLGREAALMTGLSTDFFGDRLHAALVSEGVSTAFIARKDAPTTLGFVQRDAQTGSASYAFYGTGAADRALTVADTAHDLSGVACLHLGSYSIVTPPTADALQGLVQREAGKRLISLDPNIRPTVEPDMACWRDRVARLVPCIDVIKASDEDLALLYPQAEPEAVLADWLAAGVKLAVMTRGGDGAVLRSAQGQVEVTAPAITVADTVGAGDTFQANLLDQLVTLWEQHGDDWHLKLDQHGLTVIGQQAAAAAAITCSRQGADLPTRDEVAGFMASLN